MPAGIGTPVIAGEAFAAGLRTEFLNLYERRYKAVQERLSQVMRLNIPSTRNEEDYFYYESAPHVKRWVRGDEMSSKGFKGVKWTVPNYEWAEGVSWHFADRQDDQTKSLVDHARGLGESYALLQERVFFQLLTGAVDPDLLPDASTMTCPDGAVLFNGTHGDGAARFGVSGGNTFVGSGGASPTVSTIRADFFKALQPFKRFQDTEGQPLWNDSFLDGPYVLIYPAQLEEQMREAFTQRYHVHDTGGVAVTDKQSPAVSNVILDSGQKVKLWGTQRLPDVDDFYILMASSDVKPIFSQERQPLTDVVETFENSDTVRRTGIESIRFLSRHGFGLSLPYSIIKVTSS